MNYKRLIALEWLIKPTYSIKNSSLISFVKPIIFTPSRAIVVTVKVNSTSRRSTKHPDPNSKIKTSRSMYKIRKSQAWAARKKVLIFSKARSATQESTFWERNNTFKAQLVTKSSQRICYRHTGRTCQAFQQLLKIQRRKKMCPVTLKDALRHNRNQIMCQLNNFLLPRVCLFNNTESLLTAGAHQHSWKLGKTNSVDHGLARQCHRLAQRSHSRLSR